MKNSMKNFKVVVSTNKDVQVGQNQEKLIFDLPFDLEVEIDKNGQIHNIKPRVFEGVDLFSKYHGRTMDWCSSLVEEMIELLKRVNG